MEKNETMILMAVLGVAIGLMGFATIQQSVNATGLAVKTIQASEVSNEVSVLILSPTKNPKYNTPTTPISLNGTASGINAISKVVWQNNRKGSGIAIGTTNWSISKIALYNGLNEIIVTATDSTGKTAKDTININFKDVESPKISFISPHVKAFNTQVKGFYTIAFKASDNSELEKIEIFIDDKLVQTITTPPYSFEWDTTKYKNLTHKIFAKAYDKAKNIVKTKEQQVIVSN
ncbi:MAG: Ig-like domain-containing protein [archaeon]|nr:Ig-like domain-containing protein [archaeon]